MFRRALVLGLVGLPIAFATTDARAGSYLDRAAMLVFGSSRDAAILRDKITDKELARVVRAVAEARQTAAAGMDVPAVVAKAHPHLLLTLSKVERAARAAIEGNLTTVLEHLESSKREEAIFRAALKEIGHPLPDGK